VVDANCFDLIVFVVAQTVYAFVFLRISSAILHFMAASTERAAFFPSAITSPVVIFGEYVATGCNYIVMYCADLPSYFNLSLQQQFSGTGFYFDDQIPPVFLGLVTEFGIYIALFQVDVKVLR